MAGRFVDLKKKFELEIIFIFFLFGRVLIPSCKLKGSDPDVMGASSSSSDAQEWFPSCSREIDPTCNICAPTPDCSPQRGVGSATATPLETRLPGGYPLGRGGREGMFRPANRPFTPRKLPAGSFSQVPAAAVPSQTTNVHIGSSRRLTSDRVDDSVLHSFTDQVAAAPRTPRTRAADKDIRGDS